MDYSDALLRGMRRWHAFKAKHVLMPTRSSGQCPKESSRKRIRERESNTQESVGDEICTAKQDLVSAMDGSGSLHEDGFTTLNNYALEMESKYQSEYFGKGALKVGGFEVGNGINRETGVTVSPAMNVHGLTARMEADWRHQRHGAEEGLH